MKSIAITLSVLVGLLTMNSSFAGANSLVGVWALEKSENPMPDGRVVSYCTGVHGYIIYTQEGFVSVALNCAPQGNGSEPADVSGRKFFYTGRYAFDGKTVTHTLLNASQPELIGMSFDRTVTNDGERLVLSGVNQGQTFSAHWKKVAR